MSSESAEHRTSVPTTQLAYEHRLPTPASDPKCFAAELGEPTNTARATILVLCYNKLEFTLKCVQALRANTPERLYELLLVDNASTDGTQAYLTRLQAECRNVRVLFNEANLGFVGGNNAGARMATTDNLVFLNNDTEPQPGWLEALLETIDTQPGAGAVGAKLVYPNGRLQEAGGIIFSDASGWNYGRGKDPRDPRFNFLREVDYCSGACLLVKRQLFESAGGFDMRFAPAYYEDTDLCFWVRQAGWRVLYQPAAVVIHHEGATAGTNLEQGFKRFQTVNHAKFRAKWQTALQQQCAPGEANVSRASDRRSGKHLLVVDALMPMYDRASGSRRMWEMLRLLAAAGHKVTFIARNGANGERYTRALQKLGIEVYAGDPDRMRQLGYQCDAWPLDLPALLIERKFHKAFLSFWYIAEHYLPLLRIISPQTTLYIDTVDVHYVRELRRAELEQDRQALAGIAQRKLRELRSYFLADGLIAVTPNDAEALRKELPSIEVDIIPNIHEVADDVPSFVDRNGILFVGNFAHPPNEDAVLFFHQQVWPRLRAKLPQIHWTIVGNNPPPSIQALAGNGITVTGYVPETEPYLRSHRVSIAPLRYGAGMKGKIGEAMAAGLPVVTTSVGAEGMGAGTEPFLVKDDPAGFADAVIALYTDQATWAEYSVRGRHHMGSHFSPAVVGESLERLVRKPGLISIIILCLNRLADTKLCLESIRRHSSLPYELILVDNGSTDGTVPFLRQFATSHPHVRVVLNQSNRGFAGGNNQALSLARGEHVVLLNNDTVVTPKWLEGMTQVFERCPDTAIVGPMSNYVAGPQQVSNPGYTSLELLDSFATRWTQEHSGQSTELSRVIGFCLMFRRQVLEAIGGLDERFINGNFEDDDFCLRAVNAGFRIRMAKDVFIHHTGSQTFKDLGIDYKKNILSNWEIFKVKWSIPQKTTLEQGYRVPLRLAAGESLHLPLKHLGLTCTPDQLGLIWTDCPARKKTAPTTAPSSCSLLGNLSQSRAHLERKQLSQAWTAALTAVNQRPFHPEGFLLLAKIALAGGDAQTARLCAQQARQLAPEWPAPKQFLQKALKGKVRPEWLVLPECLDHRLKGNASIRVSVGIIAKNEEKFLANCLQSVKEIADQIVVVDTGSTDRTIEIAKSFGAEVFPFGWCDDFSAARNAALEHARGDWVLILDADEELPPDQHARLKADLNNRKLIALRLPLVNEGQEAEGCSYVPRLFRNAPGVYFTGRIHEQVFPSLVALGKPWGLSTGLGTAQLLHHGYTKDALANRNKVERNLLLLEQAVQESPHDANLVMNLGLELVRAGNLQKGLEQYRQAFQIMTRMAPDELSPELREALLTQFTSHLYKAKAFQAVVEVLQSPLAKRSELTSSLHFALGLAYFELGEFVAATDQMRLCLDKRQRKALTPINRDILTAAPFHCLALSLAKSGDDAAAEKAFQDGLDQQGHNEQLRLDYAKFLQEQERPLDALHRLHELVSTNPRNVSAWRMGSQIALATPDFLEFACDWTSEAIKHMPEHLEVIAHRAEALFFSLQIDQAQELWNSIWQREHNPRVGAALVICELMDDQPRPELAVHEPDLGDISRAFIGWYQRCLAIRAQSIVSRINERLEALHSRLPAAANMIEAALNEAGTGLPANQEACPA